MRLEWCMLDCKTSARLVWQICSILEIVLLSVRNCVPRYRNYRCHQCTIPATLIFKRFCEILNIWNKEWNLLSCFLFSNHFPQILSHCPIYVLFFSGGSKEMNCYGDIFEFKRECGVSSVMIARAAEWNPSIFRQEGKLNVHDVIKEYLKYVNLQR